MRRAAFILAVMLITPHSLAWAAEGELVIDEVDVSNHPSVVILVTPPSDMGGAEDLAFSVVEAGEARDVESQVAGAEDLEVLLLIDTSGSMAGEPVRAARQAALAFLERMPDSVRLGVAIFGSTPEVVAPLAVDRGQARVGLENLEVAGETALYDGVITALEQFSEGRHRRNLVLLSDGGDTVSRASLEEVTAKLLGSGVQLHVVELQSPESDSAALHQLATAGAGSVVPVTDPAALAQVYEHIAAQLVHRYRLTYTSDSFGLTDLEVRATTGESVATASFEVAFPAAPDTTPPVEEQPEPPAMRPGQLIDIAGLWSSWALYAGAAIVYIGLAIGLLVLLAPAGKRRSLLTGWKSGERSSSGGRLLTDVADRATSLVERGIEDRGGGGRLNALLEQAGVLLRPAEFLVFVSAVAIAAFLMAWVWSGVFAALVLATAVVLTARIVLGVLRSRRQQAFGDQLDDSLQLLAGSLRAGYGILQAIDSLSREADRPTADEFRRVVLEARLGRSFHESLHAMAERLGSIDFEWVVDAIQIHGEVGGDLSEVLDNVGETIRDRNQVRRQIKALSAEGRMSAAILLVLPFAVGIMISFIVPGYIQELFNHAAGIGMLILGAVLMIIGAFWIKKIVKVVF